MKYKFISENQLILSLDRDEYINKSIKSLFANENLASGWISGIGAIYNIEIGYYDLESKKYIKKSFLDEHELTSIIGNVSFVNSDYFVHTHITISNNKFKAFGGHLFDAQIAAAAEFKIDLINKRINREYSAEIGLNLWCINNEDN